MSVVLVRAALVRGLLAIAFVILPRPGPARAEGCAVRGDALTLDSVVVRPAGAPKMTVDVSQLPATALIPTTPGAPAPLTFSGAVAFAGTAKNIWYELGKPALAHHGIVHLSAGARLARAHAEKSDVVGQLVWLSEDALEGEDKDADAWVAAVRVPCASLRLASATGSAEEAADLSPTGERSPRPPRGAARGLADGGLTHGRLRRRQAMGRRARRRAGALDAGHDRQRGRAHDRLDPAG